MSGGATGTPECGFLSAPPQSPNRTAMKLGFDRGSDSDRVRISNVGVFIMAWTAVIAAQEPKIMLQSGAEFDFTNPVSSPFTIEDIAHGLSMLCRYAGQCRNFYSVAEHSLLVSQIVPEHAFAALMHDAAEAFTGDITRPLKQMLPQFKAIERQVEEAIAMRFNLPRILPAAVKKADLAVLAAEQEQIMPPGTSLWAVEANIMPANIKVRGLSPEDAKREFLDRFNELTKRNARLRISVV